MAEAICIEAGDLRFFFGERRARRLHWQGGEFSFGDLGIIALAPPGKHLITKVRNSEHNLRAVSTKSKGTVVLEKHYSAPVVGEGRGLGIHREMDAKVAVNKHHFATSIPVP